MTTKYKIDDRGIVRNNNGFPAHCPYIKEYCLNPRCLSCPSWVRPVFHGLPEPTPADRIHKLLWRIARNKIKGARVFRTWYKTKTGEWTEKESEGYWYPCCSSPHAALTCDIRTESYYLIDGTQYDDFDEATWAMYDKLFVKPAIVPVLDVVVKEWNRQERKRKALKNQRKIAGIKIDPTQVLAQGNVTGAIA